MDGIAAHELCGVYKIFLTVKIDDEKCFTNTNVAIALHCTGDKGNTDAGSLVSQVVEEDAVPSTLIAIGNDADS